MENPYPNKWIVTIVEVQGRTTPYDCETGPGSVESPSIGESPEEAAMDFFNKISDGSGGWGKESDDLWPDIISVRPYHYRRNKFSYVPASVKKVAR